MKDLCLFLNTRIEGSGFFAGAGDLCLSPVRYWCNGHTVRIAMVEQNVQPGVMAQGQQVDHVQSFHPRGRWHNSRTNLRLDSSQTGMLKALFAVALFVPGLFLGVICKTFAYLFADMRERHDLAKRHYMPIVRHIGTPERPIASEDALREELNREFYHNPLHQPTDAIIIHGRDLNINREPGLLERFNPMKLILDGARIVHASCVRARLDDEMVLSRKWDVEPVRRISNAGEANNPAANAQNGYTIEEALRDTPPRRGWFTCKRLHRVYNVPQQRQAAAVAEVPVPVRAAQAVAHA